MLLFLIEFRFLDPGYALSICALFNAYTNPKRACVSLSLEVGNTFLMLSYFETKSKHVFDVMRFDAVMLLFLFLLKLSQVSAGYAL